MMQTRARVTRTQGRLRAGDDTIAHWFLIIAVVLAPLPFGSADRLVAAFWCVWLGTGLLLALAKPLPRCVHPWLAGAAIIVLGYVLVLIAQGHAFALPDQAHPVWNKTGALLQAPIEGRPSVVRGTTWYAVVAPLAGLLAFLLGLVSSSTSNMRLRIATFLGGAVACYALFGVVSSIHAPGMILWKERVAYIGYVTGPFVNANTAADFFSIGVLAAMISIIERGHRRFSRSQLSGAWLHPDVFERVFLKPRGLLLLSALFICLVALLMSRSRAGVSIGMGIFIWTFMMLDIRSGSFARRLVLPVAIALGALILVGDAVFHRFAFFGLSGGGRGETFVATLAMIADHPWLGVGLGTFPDAFPAYRGSGNLQGVWEFAHSTPLELAAEAGLPLASLVVLAWTVMLWSLYQRFQLSGERIAKLAFPAMLVAVVHSFVDFSLQITGLAIPLLALCGAALRVEIHEKRKH